MESNQENVTSNVEEDISTAVTNILERIQLLKDFAALHLRREEVSSDVQELNNRLPSIQHQLYQCNEIFANFDKSIKHEYKSVLESMRRQQMAMLYLLGEVQKKQRGEIVAQTANCPTPKNASVLKLANSAVETPRLYLSEYQQSPYVTKLRPVALYFLDFEATIALQQFNGIPKYLRGRETCDELNNFLHNVIVPCFMEKYQLLHRKRECIRNPQDLDLWKMFREQLSYFPGQKFITQGDLSRKMEKVIDKKMCTRIAMLRHLGILQEQRKPPIVCYIWIANNGGATN